MLTKILVITGSGNGLVLSHYPTTEPSKLDIWYVGFEGNLTYWGLVTPYGNTILVTIGSVNGFTSLVPGHCMQGWGQFNFNSRNWNWNKNWTGGIEKMESEILESGLKTVKGIKILQLLLQHLLELELELELSFMALTPHAKGMPE